MNEAERSAYLKALGIDHWIPRSSALEDPVDSSSDRIGWEPPPPSASPEVPPVSVLSPNPGANAEPQSPAMTEPPSWLDEVPPPSHEYLPSMDVAEYGEPFGAEDLRDDGVRHLDWQGLEARVAQCQACELHKTRTRTVFGVGQHDADLMIIGEAPGADEDRTGEPFVGRAGHLLNAMLQAIGLRRDQVFIANILKCRPPENRNPRADEASSCAPYLQRQVALVRPRAILAVGAVAAQNLLQSDDAVGRLRGGAHQYNGIPVVVTYHPAYLLRSPDQKAKAWDDLQRAAKLIR